MTPVPEKPTIFTIGHSNHPIDTFIDMLKVAEIDAVADVRSVPYSKRHPQYRKDELAARLKGEGIAYVFLGKELGAGRTTQIVTSTVASSMNGLPRRPLLTKGCDGWKRARRASASRSCAPNASPSIAIVRCWSHVT